MSKNYNKITSRDMFENVSKICGLNKAVTNNFAKIVSDALVHDVACRVLESDKAINNFCIELPYIGCLFIEYSNNTIKPIGIKLEPQFNDSLLKAVNNGESPLIKHAEESMVKNLKDKYSAII